MRLGILKNQFFVLCKKIKFISTFFCQLQVYKSLIVIYSAHTIALQKLRRQGNASTSLFFHRVE